MKVLSSKQDALRQLAAGVSRCTKKAYDYMPSRSNFLRAKFARAADRFSLLSGFLLRRFLEMLLELHFTEYAFALKLFLQNPKGLINVVVADTNLHVAPTIIHK